MSADAPDILLVVLDTLRADALEPYGAPAGASPVLADLARAGRALPDVRATASWTLPSHASMFTGRFPRELGLGQAPAETPPSARPVVQAQRDRLLAEVLRRAGYVTRGVTTNMWAGSPSGFDTGFDAFVDIDTSRQARMEGGPRNQARWYWEAVVRRDLDDGAAAAGEVLQDWIAGPRRGPSFTFTNIVECHSPYLPPEPYAGVGWSARVRAAGEARRHLNLRGIFAACVGATVVPDEALARMRHLYAGCVRYADAWVGWLLERLERTGRLDDTLVIVTSDHGENLGENGLLAHALSLDERLIHVPFVAAGPGADALEGMRSLVELPARLARVTGLASHPWPAEPVPGGVAVAQFDPFTPPGDERIAGLSRELGVPVETLAPLTTPQTCAVDGPLKLLRRGAAEALYDLAADPLERAPVPLERADPARLARLRAALDAPAVAARPAGPAPAAAPASEDEVAEIEQRMRLMGYL